MRWLVTSLFLAFIVMAPFRALGKTLTVAVIDTGIDSISNKKLCKKGHKSFVSRLPDALSDENGHGTHVAGLIVKNAGDADYCLVAMKYYSWRNSPQVNFQNFKAALRYAINIKVDYINISGGGGNPDREEFELIQAALKKKIKVIVAAGNEDHDLSAHCDYYPACYDPKIVIVGNLQSTSNSTLTRSPSSNYGSNVNRWEIGTELESDLPGGKLGTMTGTSQATAVATGKMIKARFKKH